MSMEPARRVLLAESEWWNQVVLLFRTLYSYNINTKLYHTNSLKLLMQQKVKTKHSKEKVQHSKYFDYNGLGLWDVRDSSRNHFRSSYQVLKKNQQDEQKKITPINTFMDRIFARCVINLIYYDKYYNILSRYFAIQTVFFKVFLLTFYLFCR